jgi:hypothetical protein
MSALVQGEQIRQVNLGVRAFKATGTLAATTVNLFNITGGRVRINCIYGVVTTIINVANAYKLVSDPTAATVATIDLFAATELNPTPVGDLISIPTLGGTLTRGGAVQSLSTPIELPIGAINHVSLGTAGNITWNVFWLPLDDGAVLAAA